MMELRVKTPMIGPIAVPREAAGVISDTTIMTLGMTMPPPTPWRPRKSASCAKDVERAHARLNAVKTITAPSNTVRRPRSSERRPTSGATADCASRKAVMHHDTSARQLNSAAICGIAVTTIVISRPTMKHKSITVTKSRR